MPQVGKTEIFHGELSDALARVYVRIPVHAKGRRPRLTGYVRGPFCVHSQTIPSTSPLAELDDLPNREPARHILATAAVPEPCFWTPQLPMLYDVRVDVLEANRTVATAQHTIGMRRLGPLGRSLKFEGKRWVVRGVGKNVVDTTLPSIWRNVSAAMVACDPDDSLCEACSREGVLIVARSARSGAALKKELQRLSSWAAVGIVVVQADVGDAEGIQAAAANMLLAQLVPAGRPVVPHVWADLLACELDEPATFAAKIAECTLPTLALKNYGRFSDVPRARAECDQLQRELAPLVDVTGYLVV